MKIFNKILGFRSGKKINKIIASIYYLFILFSLFAVFGQIDLMFMVSSLLLLPFITVGIIDVIKNKQKIKSKYFFRKVITPFIIMNLLTFISISLSSTNLETDVASIETELSKNENKELNEEENKISDSEEIPNKTKNEINLKESNKKENKTKTSEIDKIILSKGHPTYYGKLEDAKKYAKKVSKKHIVVEGRYDKDTVLFIDGYDQIIRDIEIYPKNINEVITEEKAIDIVDKYLPKDVLNKYYREPSYELYKPEDNSKNTYKVINYGLTEEGSNSYYNKEHNYSGQVTVIIEEGKNGVESIVFKFGTPKWMNFAHTNGYNVEEWIIK